MPPKPKPNSKQTKGKGQKRNNPGKGNPASNKQLGKPKAPPPSPPPPSTSDDEVYRTLKAVECKTFPIDYDDNLIGQNPLVPREAFYAGQTGYVETCNKDQYVPDVDETTTWQRESLYTFLRGTNPPNPQPQPITVSTTHLTEAQVTHLKQMRQESTRQRFRTGTSSQNNRKPTVVVLEKKVPKPKGHNPTTKENAANGPMIGLTVEEHQAKLKDGFFTGKNLTPVVCATAMFPNSYFGESIVSIEKRILANETPKTIYEGHLPLTPEFIGPIDRPIWEHNLVAGDDVDDEEETKPEKILKTKSMSIQ